MVESSCAFGVTREGFNDLTETFNHCVVGGHIVAQTLSKQVSACTSLCIPVTNFPTYPKLIKDVHEHHGKSQTGV